MKDFLSKVRGVEGRDRAAFEDDPPLARQAAGAREGVAAEVRPGEGVCRVHAELLNCRRVHRRDGDGAGAGREEVVHAKS